MITSCSIWLIFVASWLFISSSAFPTENHNTFNRRQDDAFSITGVGGSVQPRLELRELENNADQMNMFLLALQRMQQAPQEERLSYFQIAAIHGRPEAPWNGVQGIRGGNPGYCAHNSNLFLPWHRPFLALIEQIVVGHARDIASEFQGSMRTRMTAAAAALRFPYWDWARDGNVVPRSMVSRTFTVTTPNGTRSIDNPLYSYRFHPIDQRPGVTNNPGFVQQFTRWPETLRNPTSNFQPDASSNVAALERNLNSIRPGLKQRLYTLFTNYNRFSNFSNEAWVRRAGAGNFDSIESVHNNIHGTVGGINNGHMSVVDVSAFDPAFWLHHTMVDRCFAMFQVLYPDTYVESQAQDGASYWFERGTILDSESPLMPFYASPGRFWTSNTARSTRTFGYTYSDLGEDASVRTVVNTLYGPRDAPSAKSKRDVQYTEPQVLYHVNIRAPKNSLESTFFIDIFTGEPASITPSSWPQDPNFSGSQAVPAMSADANGMSWMPTIDVTGVVPLNPQLEKLVGSGELKDLDLETVKSYLRANLVWKIRLSDGYELPAEQVPDLQVSVASIEIKFPTQPDEFPMYLSNWRVHPDVTEGKVGGLCPSDEI